MSSKTLNEVMALANRLGLANDEACYYVSRKMVKSEKKLLIELCWNALDQSKSMLNCARYYRHKLEEAGLEAEPIFKVEEIVTKHEIETVDGFDHERRTYE